MLRLIPCLLAGAILAGCATITGGTRYNATIVVREDPSAEIIYQGQVLGKGSAVVQVKRSEADRFSYSVIKRDCEPVEFRYSSKAFRGWACFGSYMSFGLIGILVDALNGSLWRPDEREPGIQRMSARDFFYFPRLPECAPAEKKIQAEKPSASVVVKLFNGRRLKGRIVENIPNQYLKIKTEDDVLHTIPQEEVLEISPE
jgi:hypothetical protein